MDCFQQNVISPQQSRQSNLTNMMEKRNKAQSNQGKANLAALSKRDRSVNEDLNNFDYHDNNSKLQ